MAKHSKGDTHFTGQVKVLLQKIYGHSSLKNSVLESAVEYYDSYESIQIRKNELSEEIEILSTKSDKKSISVKAKLIREQKEYLNKLSSEKYERYNYLHTICSNILSLCEGDTLTESNRKSAQLLGTIQLLSPTEGKNLAMINEMNKPLYKGVLALRLLDQICLNDSLPNAYVSQILDKEKFVNYENLATENKTLYQHFVEYVKIPVLMAAILQDIGTHHPEAQKIIQDSEEGKDSSRNLVVATRKMLLQINYRETIKYVVDGMGTDIYKGNSKVERDQFNKLEEAKLKFLKYLIKDGVQAKQGLGNLLKVPQLYVSMLFSTKKTYNYKLLPKIYQALYQNAERGVCRKDIVDLLYKITGMFPQGYGVTYIPENVEGKVIYEYGVVSHLYPENPEEPICRAATKNLSFIDCGYDVTIKKNYNLYYADTVKKFAMISKERLNEILELLASNYEERQDLDLLPRCWAPMEYFSRKPYQKLWNKPLATIVPNKLS